MNIATPTSSSHYRRQVCTCIYNSGLFTRMLHISYLSFTNRWHQPSWLVHYTGWYRGLWTAVFNPVTLCLDNPAHEAKTFSHFLFYLLYLWDGHNWNLWPFLRTDLLLPPSQINCLAQGRMEGRGVGFGGEDGHPRTVHGWSRLLWHSRILWHSFQGSGWVFSSLHHEHSWQCSILGGFRGRSFPPHFKDYL